MAGFFRGQTQVISLIMLTSVVIALVGLAYIWGVPFIEKRASMTEFSAKERFIEDLRDKIVELSRAEGGEVEIELNQMSLRLIPFQATGGLNSTLIMKFALSQPMIFPNVSVYLGATSFDEINGTGTYGEASPSVVELSCGPAGSFFENTAKITFRELLKNEIPERGYIIALCPKTDATCTQGISGNQLLKLSFDRNVIKPGQASNSGDLVITYINVELA